MLNQSFFEKKKNSQRPELRPLIKLFVRGTMWAIMGNIYIIHLGLFPPWLKEADPWPGVHIFLGPVLVLWQSEENPKHTLYHRLAGGLVVATGER